MLGICLGMQVSLDYSEKTTLKPWVCGGRVQRFQLNRPELKIPHMGWNEVGVIQAHPVLAGIEPGDEFYFVRYFPNTAAVEHVLAVTDYEDDFTCALGKDNYIGTPISSGEKRSSRATTV